MKINELAISAKQLEEIQSASKQMSPEQARIKAMQQGIARQKEALAPAKLKTR
uniref:hypothetical protein n=1 Tax=Shewanella sp. TaxID=50422 RepID=UPI00404720DC